MCLCLVFSDILDAGYLPKWRRRTEYADADRLLRRSVNRGNTSAAIGGRAEKRRAGDLDWQQLTTMQQQDPKLKRTIDMLSGNESAADKREGGTMEGMQRNKRRFHVFDWQDEAVVFARTRGTAIDDDKVVEDDETADGHAVRSRRNIRTQF